MLEPTVKTSLSFGETVTISHPEAFLPDVLHLQPFSPPSVQLHLAVALETSAEVTAGCHVTQTVPPPLCVRAIGSSLPPPRRPLVIYELSAWSAAPPGDEESPSCFFFVAFFLLERWSKTNSR